jgi:beta-1,4-mannosyltransferase
MSAGISVLVTPRDVNPYQELLYRGVTAAGIRIRYAEGPTRSKTLNGLLQPAMLVWYRMHGFRILHIHWVFQFSLPWARQRRWASRAMEWSFNLYLSIASRLGFAIVWTAHDLLPHEPVFGDDRRARDFLLAKASVVIALSEATAAELTELGARQVRLIPSGPYLDQYPVTLTSEEARASFQFEPEDWVVLLIGQLSPYKGADLLLLAAHELPPTSRIKIMVVGSCRDEEYRNTLNRLAAESEGRAMTRIEWIPDQDLARYMQAANVAAFPFREITNSSSVILAESFGLPVVIPDLKTLREIPEATAVRFEPGIEGLIAALQQTEHMSKSEYAEMSAAASAWATKTDWSTAARLMIETYQSLQPEQH